MVDVTHLKMQFHIFVELLFTFYIAHEYFLIDLIFINDMTCWSHNRFGVQSGMREHTSAQEKWNWTTSIFPWLSLFRKLLMLTTLLSSTQLIHLQGTHRKYMLRYVIEWCHVLIIWKECKEERTLSLIFFWPRLWEDLEKLWLEHILAELWALSVKSTIWTLLR